LATGVPGTRGFRVLGWKPGFPGTRGFRVLGWNSGNFGDLWAPNVYPYASNPTETREPPNTPAFPQPE